MIQGFLREPAARMPATIAAGEVLLFYLSGDLKLPHPGLAARQASTNGNKKQQERQAKWKIKFASGTKKAAVRIPGEFAWWGISMPVSRLALYSISPLFLSSCVLFTVPFMTPARIHISQHAGRWLQIFTSCWANHFSFPGPSFLLLNEYVAETTSYSP